MAQFSLFMTEKALADIRELTQYIRIRLGEPETAHRQQERIKQAIYSLAQVPERYALVPDDYLREHGVRFFPIDNYLVFYTVNMLEHHVYILRVLYSRRDWQMLLSMDSPSS